MVFNPISLIRQLFEPRSIQVAIDPRPSSEKAKDFYYGEDILLPKANTGKRITKLSFKPYNQKQTFACGAFAASHARLIYENRETEPAVWYRSRTNYPGAGMYLKDVLKLASKASEERFNVEYTEQAFNAMPLKELFDNDRDTKYQYAQINPYDADAVWSAVSNGFPVIIAFYATNKEWVEEMYEREWTTVNLAPVRHYVTVLPNSNHEKDGKEWVSVVDSSPSNGFALRHLTKDFIKKRMYLGGGFYYPATSAPAKKVKSNPTQRVEYGQRNSGVITLQSMLNELGLMQSLHITGYYGNITARAVLTWQLANLVNADKEQLKAWEGKYWGPSSINRVKELYFN